MKVIVILLILVSCNNTPKNYTEYNPLLILRDENQRITCYQNANNSSGGIFCLRDKKELDKE